MANNKTCGCGKSLEGQHYQAVRCDDCWLLAKKAQRAKQRLSSKARGYTRSGKTTQSPQYLASIKSLGDTRRVVSDQYATRVSSKVCNTCCGMSWRRIGWCVECKQWYAPEPPPEPPSALRSSMGTTVEQGRLSGYSGVGGGHHGKGK